jgi:hypothetical protein
MNDTIIKNRIGPSQTYYVWQQYTQFKRNKAERDVHTVVAQKSFTLPVNIIQRQLIEVNYQINHGTCRERVRWLSQRCDDLLRRLI